MKNYLSKENICFDTDTDLLNNCEKNESNKISLIKYISKIPINFTSSYLKNNFNIKNKLDISENNENKIIYISNNKNENINKNKYGNKTENKNKNELKNNITYFKNNYNIEQNKKNLINKNILNIYPKSENNKINGIKYIYKSPNKTIYTCLKKHFIRTHNYKTLIERQKSKLFNRLNITGNNSIFNTNNSDCKCKNSLYKGLNNNRINNTANNSILIINNNSKNESSYYSQNMNLINSMKKIHLKKKEILIEIKIIIKMIYPQVKKILYKIIIIYLIYHIIQLLEIINL